jgi:hypothetical protein
MLKKAQRAKGNRWWEWLAAMALFALAGLLLVSFFARWPIEGTSLALDWKGIWNDLQGGRPHFNTDSLLIVPWDGLLLLPLGWLPLRASWAVATLLTITVLVVSVPAGYGKPRQLMGIFLLATAYPAIRHIVDGNLEGMVIGGLLLTVYGYERQKIWPLAAGLLLTTAKVQEAWVPCLVLGVYLLRTWPAKRLLALLAILAAVVVPTMLWLGPEWIFGLTHVVERGSIMDSSLISTLGRLAVPSWLTLASWIGLAILIALYAWRSGPTFSRPKASALVAASLLLSPYAAGNSYLTLLAVGIIPLLLTLNLPAMILLLLVDLSYFAQYNLLLSWSATYWAVLMLLWIAIAASQRQAERQPGPSAVASATVED